MHKEWFEPVLARHLDRVAAPEELVGAGAESGGWGAKNAFTGV